MNIEINNMTSDNKLNRIDSLILSKGTGELNQIFEENKKNILANTPAGEYSLIELNEYIEQALELIGQGRESEAINLPIRKLLETK